MIIRVLVLIKISDNLYGIITNIRTVEVPRIESDDVVDDSI